MDDSILNNVGGVNTNSLLNVLSTDNEHDEPDHPVQLIKHSAYFDHDSLTKLLKEKKQTFTILSTNIASIRLKFDELDIFITELSEQGLQFSAICMQETWLTENDDSSLFNLTGYTCISQGKSCSERGGLIIYLNNKFNYNILPVCERFEKWEGQFIEISGFLSSKFVILGNLYRLPREGLNDYNEFINEFIPVLDKLEKCNSDIAVAGDFNINLLNVTKKDKIGTYFNTIIAQGFLPLITLPTRFTNTRGTLIDNILCKISNKTLNSTSGILVDKFSDHQPYFTSLEISTCHEKPPRFVTLNKQSEELTNNFVSDLQSSNILDEFDLDPKANPNENFNILDNIICTCKEKKFPCKKVRFNKYKHKNSKWITPGIIKSIQFRNNLYKHMHTTNPKSNQFFIIKTNLRNYNTILKDSIRRAKQFYFKSCFHNFKHNMKKTWSTINGIMKRGKTNNDFPDFFKINNRKLSDKSEIANEFNLYFTNIGPNIADKIKTPHGKSYKDYLTKKPLANFIFQNINEKDVDKIIQELDPKFSSGKDGISNFLLKSIKSIVIKPLSIIINQMLSTGIFPDRLKVAKVVPLFKKGDKSLFSNYRPISLLPSISKIFEKVIFYQLYAYLEDHKLLYTSQYGFRKKHSTELAALELIDKVTFLMQEGKTPVGIFLDMSKAFDTLNHEIVLDKLAFYGISCVTKDVFNC